MFNLSTGLISQIGGVFLLTKAASSLLVSLRKRFLSMGRLGRNPALLPNTSYVAHVEISISQHTCELLSKPK